MAIPIEQMIRIQRLLIEPHAARKAAEGMISERDVAYGLAVHKGELHALPVSALMTRTVIACSPDDDVALGPVNARWALEEFYSTPDDDDVKFVGSVNDSGLFTPAGEGPNPARKKQSNNFPTNNWGDVWVEAAFDTGGETLKSKSYLVVTIPQYIRYEQPEDSQ